MNTTKRIWSIVLLLMATTTATWALTKDSDGCYLLSSAQDLTDFAALVNDGTTTADAKLMADITLTERWEGIGTSQNSFNGTFDGQGHTVSGVTGNSGLFSVIGSSGTVKRVVVDGSIYSGDGAGGIANSSSGTITQCGFIGSVGGGGGTNNGHVAGIVAYSSGLVSNCFNRGSVSARYVGGIVGYLTTSGTVRNCYNAGQLTMDIIKTSSAIVGDRYGTVSDCYTLEGSASHCGSEGYAGTIKNAAQFASGEVCYLLQQSAGDEMIWGQNIGTDAYPIFSSDYSVYVWYDYSTETYLNHSDGKIPYAIWCEGNTTLYFDYSANGLNIGDTYDGQTITTLWSGHSIVSSPTDAAPVWNETCKESVTRVVFTESFRDVQPLSLSRWFYNFTLLTDIVGIGNLDTSGVTAMDYMFYNCSSIEELNLMTFDISNLTISKYMFSGCINLNVIYCDKTFNSKVTTTNGENMFTRCDHLVGPCNASSMQNQGSILVQTNAGVYYAQPSKLFTETIPTEKIFYAIWCEENFTMYFDYIQKTIYGGNLYHGKKVNAVFSGDDALVNKQWKSYSGVRYFSHASNNLVNINDRCQTMVFQDAFKDIKPTDLSMWFYGYNVLKTIEGMENLDTSEATDMNYLFYNCGFIRDIDLSHFNTSKVTDMSGMFCGCSSLNYLDLSSLNTSKVKNMGSMFSSCDDLKTIVWGHLDTSELTDMNCMFYGCEELENIDLSGFDTRNVTNLSSLFYKCYKLKSIDLSGFNTASVERMSQMFYQCYALKEVNFGSIDVTKVTTTADMFWRCNQLTTIYCNTDWKTGVNSSHDQMFRDCSSLKGAIDYSYGNWNIDYANPTTGYFTSLSSLTPYAIWCDGNKTLYFAYTKDVINGGDTFDGQAITTLWSGDNQVTNYTGNAASWSNVLSDVERVVFDQSFIFAKPKNLSSFFYNASKLTTIKGWEYLNTSEATSMFGMFQGCSKLKALDLSSFNTGKVNNMQNMFAGCTLLQAVIVGDGWDASTCAETSNMFYNTPIVGEDGTAANTDGTSYGGNKAHTGAGGFMTKKYVRQTMKDGGDYYTYATYYKSNVNRMIDNNNTDAYVDVYTGVVNSDGTELELSRVSDRIIKAGQGVVLKSNTEFITLTSTTEEATGDFSTNALKGCDQATPTSEINGRIYVLSKNNGYPVGFYYYTGRRLDANKAYLSISYSAAAPMSWLPFIEGDDVVTSVSEELKVEQKATASDKCFDLSGRQVNGQSLKHGIYIVNGRKVIIK